MSRERLAAAYEELAALHSRVADQYAQVAHELMGNEQPGAGESAVPSTQSPAPAALPPSRTARTIDPARPSEPDQGECPKHHKPWTPGQYGDYCTAQTD